MECFHYDLMKCRSFFTFSLRCRTDSLILTLIPKMFANVMLSTLNYLSYLSLDYPLHESLSRNLQTSFD